MARFRRIRPRVVVPLADFPVSSGRKDTQVGVLGRALSAAEHHGAVTPESWVLLADMFRQVVLSILPPGHDPASLLRTILRPAGVERAAHARSQLLSVELDAEMERELDEVYRAASDGAPWGLAVRASAVLPDSGLARAAGVASTELAVTSRDELGAAIRRVWSLGVSERSLAYLRAKKIRDLAIAVVLQPVVPARHHLCLVTDGRSLAGSAEAGDASAGSAPTRILSVLPGLGVHPADTGAAEIVHLDSHGAVLFRRPPAPARSPVVRRGRLTWLPPESEVLELPPARLAEVAEIARRFEPLGPSVVQCAVPREGEIVVVDLEPLHHSGAPALGNASTLWGRASVENGSAEPLSPLSRELSLAPALDRVQKALGDRAPRASRLSEWIAPVNGRLMMNLTPFLEQGSEGAIHRIESAGAQWAPELAEKPTAASLLPIVGLRLAQIVTELSSLSEAIGRFEREAEQQRRWLSEMDLGILPDDALSTTLAEVKEFLMRARRLDARASASAVACHALLSSVLAAQDGAHASFLAHTISAGADVITLRPAVALCHVAEIGRLDPAGREALMGGTSELPDGPLARAIERFLLAYGDRGLLENELAVPRFGEDRGALLSLMATLLRGESVDAEVAVAQSRALADRQFSLIEQRLSFFEGRLCRDLVSRYREHLRLRERCRARVAHGLAMMRFVALDVDRRIRRLDPSLEENSALFLTLDELSVAVKRYRADLSPIVRARRLDLEAERRSDGPPPCFRGIPEPLLAARASRAMHGIPCATGTAEARVTRLGPRLEGLDAFQPGDVLAVQSLDLGHAPLFFQARAVVSELGTPTASAAVVARDCGIPVVACLPGLLQVLRNGDRVAVDGDAGTVERLGP